MRSKVYEVKNIEEAKQLAVKEFNASLDDIQIEVLKESKGFLGIGAKVEVKATLTVDGIEKGKKYIQMILDNNHIEGFIEKKIRDNNVEFNIDVGGYKKKRVKSLENMAVEYGKQVARTKQVIKLDSLNAYERKIIHNKLSSWKDVQTHSEGEEPNRVLIIEPKF